MQSEAALGRDELEAALRLEGVQVPAGLPADGQDVLEARGGDQGDAAALPLEERVGGHGGAVDDEDGGGVLQDIADALEDGPRRVLRGREDLAVGEAAVAIDDEVGESPAGIDPDADLRRSSFGVPWARGLLDSQRPGQVKAARRGA